MKLDELPISEITLVLWVTFQSRFLQAQTLQGYLYGIQHWSLTEANVDPLKDCKLLKKLIAKLTKTQRGPAPKRSVTLNVLRAIRPYFDLKIHDHRCVWAMMCLSVALLLRIGEAVPATNTGAFIIRGKDWRSLGGSAGTLFLRRSKMDVKREGILLRCPPCPDTEICPLSAMDEYITRSDVDLPETRPLFLRRNGRPLTRAYVISALRKAVQKAGLPVDAWSGISFRKGGALSLALGGVPDRLIQSLGRWSSTCFKRYVSLIDAEVDRAARLAARSGTSAAVEWRQAFLATQLYED